MSMLERYEFPGNLLELAHALTHAFVLARGAPIEPKHLPASIRDSADGNGARPGDGVIAGDLEALDVVAKRFEREYLLRVLRSVGGNLRLRHRRDLMRQPA
jgi:DNA-binding NtrC family response regulator